jgi:hypothetical protein
MFDILKKRLTFKINSINNEKDYPVFKDIITNYKYLIYPAHRLSFKITTLIIFGVYLYVFYWLFFVSSNSIVNKVAQFLVISIPFFLFSFRPFIFRDKIYISEQGIYIVIPIFGPWLKPRIWAHRWQKIFTYRRPNDYTLVIYNYMALVPGATPGSDYYEFCKFPIIRANKEIIDFIKNKIS